MSDETKRKLVCRSRDAHAQTNAWERRIIELSDGRPLSEITGTLYIDELKAGAWAADIGLWKHLSDRSVIETVHTLASRGAYRSYPTTTFKEELDGRYYEKKDPNGRAENRKEESGQRGKSQVHGATPE